MPHTKPILIGIIYKPPNDSQFLKVLQSTIENAIEFNLETYIMGDININMDKNYKNNLAIVNEYNEFWKTQGLLLIIKSYTHVSKTSR